MLRNKFAQRGKPYGETDPDKLDHLEQGAVAIRLEELAQHPITGRFDYDHMKAIHRYLFQDVYECGPVEERVGPTAGFMTKSGPDIVHFAFGDPAAPEVPYNYYPAEPALTAAAEEQYRRLAELGFLRGIDADTFVRELAEIWGELNTGGSALSGGELFCSVAAH